MTATLTGSCSCNAVQVQVIGDPVFVALCHCLNCQKSSSSAFSTNWVVPETNFSYTASEPKTYQVNEATKKRFCGDCGSNILTESTKFPGIVVVKAGIMNDSLAKYTPASESFTKRKPLWLGCVEGAQQFSEKYGG